MGLAASQARFLTLTARKSNIEFQGQQINQQRTVLANQSADLYNRMLDLQVPVPPSMTDSEYYQVTQQFNQDGTTKKIIGEPSVIYDASVDSGNGGWAFQFNTEHKVDGETVTGTITTAFITQAAGGGAPVDPNNLTDAEIAAAQDALVAAGVLDLDDQAGTLIQSVVLDADNDNELLSSGDPDDLTLDQNDFSFGTTFDNDKYDDAMNTYEYEKFSYEKAMADINAETEAIYQKDKTLELKLKQLDSEHMAVQTEVDAVKKVIDKNVEKTFKTFG